MHSTMHNIIIKNRSYTERFIKMFGSFFIFQNIFDPIFNIKHS